ncbi:hypothetical protein ACFQ0B_48850 [Nonomuraea thailandensis]
MSRVASRSRAVAPSQGTSMGPGQVCPPPSIVYRRSVVPPGQDFQSRTRIPADRVPVARPAHSKRSAQPAAASSTGSSTTRSASVRSSPVASWNGWPPR